MTAREELAPYKDVLSGHAVEVAKSVTFYYDKLMGT